MADARLAQAKLFLETLFEDACAEGLYYSIYCLPSRRVRFFNKIDEEVIKYCFHACDVEKQNVYAGMGLFREPIMGGGRGKSEDVAGIVALYGDFDIRKSPDDTRHPETVDQALELARIGEFRPSMYVLSGSGVHVYWLLKEPWIFEDSAEHGEADTLVKRTSDTLRSLSNTKGFDLDYMKDLVRVFRVPGTKNYKRVDNITGVELVMPVGDPPRYERDDFEPYLVAPESLGSPVVGQHTETVAHMGLDPNASLPPEMLQMAFQADDGFEDTWRMRREKEFGGDVSRYDQAIANALVDAEWTDDQVATAITHFRREIAGKPKVDHKGRLRLDYYQATILKAKNASAGRKGKERIESGTLIAGAGGPVIDTKTGKSLVDDKTRDTVLAAVRSVIKVDIQRWVQVGLDDPTYYLVTKEGKKLVIGGDNEFEKSHLFRRRLRSVFGVIVPSSVSKTWEDVISHLTAVRELDTTDDPQKSDRVVTALRSYLIQRHTLEGDGAAARAVTTSNPYAENGSVFVNFNDFDEWHQERRLKIYGTPNEGRTLFRMAGADPKQISGARPSKGSRPKLRYWKFSNELMDGVQRTFDGVRAPDALGDELE